MTTIDEVIEEHRQKIGAKKVHLTLGPEATPEGVRDNLELIRVQHEEWESFSECSRLRAEIDQLKNRLGRISKLALTNYRDVLEQPKEVRDIKHAILHETDIIALNLSEAIEFCRKERK